MTLTFLLEQVYRYVNSLFDRGLITDWFFVRYNDPKNHLRIRFCCKKDHTPWRLIADIQEWASTLIENENINEMTISTYEREVERYGGEQLIEAAEALFCADTETTLAIIRTVSEKKTIMAEEVLAALSMINFLQQLGLGLKDQLSFFSSLGMSKEELSGFRQWKNDLVSIAQTFFENTPEAKNHVTFLYSAFNKRINATRAYAKVLLEMEEKQKLTTSRYSIYESFLHMHCNRLLGRSGKEKKARLYAYHALTILQGQKKGCF